MDIRKTVILRETTNAEMGKACKTPVNRVAGLGVIANPFAGKYQDDLTELFQAGHDLGEILMTEMVPLLPGAAISYGKAAIVGVNGDIENGHAMLHPMLGKPMREPIGGGEALIPSAVKIGGPATSLEIPLGHKDDPWSFDHFDAMTVSLADGPRPDEILMAIAIADAGRPVPRAGKTRAVT